MLAIPAVYQHRGPQARIQALPIPQGACSALWGSAVSQSQNAGGRLPGVRAAASVVGDGLLPQAPCRVLTLIYRPDKELARSRKICALSLWQGGGGAAPEPPQQFQLYLSWGFLGKWGLAAWASPAQKDQAWTNTLFRAASWHGSSRDTKPQKQPWDSHSHGTMTQDRAAHPYQ